MQCYWKEWIILSFLNLMYVCMYLLSWEIDTWRSDYFSECELGIYICIQERRPVIPDSVHGLQNSFAVTSSRWQSCLHRSTCKYDEFRVGWRKRQAFYVLKIYSRVTTDSFHNNKWDWFSKSRLMLNCHGISRWETFSACRKYTNNGFYEELPFNYHISIS